MRHTIIKDRVRGFRSTGVVIRGGKILLMHQVFRGEDFYNLPGGGLEKDETLEDACAREILEEFNIEVAVGRLIYILDSPRRLNFVFLCEYVGGVARLGGPEALRKCESDQYFVEWADLSEIVNINLQPAETKHCLLKYLSDTNQPTFFDTTVREVNKNILIVAPQYYTIPPLGYGGIERIVTLAYLQYRELGYQVDVVSKEGSKFHTYNLSDLPSIDFKKYKFILTYYYKEPTLRALDRQDAQLYIILQNNYKNELSFLCGLEHSKIYVLSEDQRRQYRENLGEEYDILPNGVDMRQFRITGSARTRDIVYIGALGQHKSPLSCLTYAIKHDFCIDFYGPEIFTAEEEAYAELFKERLASYPKAHYCGELGDDDKKVELLNTYKYFIFLPGIDKKAWIEPFGLAPLEAMACGCTVITDLTSGGHRSFCTTANTTSFLDRPNVLNADMIRESVLTFDFERVFKLYYPK